MNLYRHGAMPYDAMPACNQLTNFIECSKLIDGMHAHERPQQQLLFMPWEHTSTYKALWIPIRIPMSIV